MKQFFQNPGRKPIAQFALGMALSLAGIDQVRGASNVFLDFSGSWATRLNELAASAGVTNFDAGERSTIQNSIQSKLQTMYSNYNVTFHSSAPAGDFTTINFDNTFGAGVLGQAPLDFMNVFEVQTVEVYPANFGFILDEFTGSTSRGTQIAQLSAALAGTAGHELAHSQGLRHHHAYGTDGITPANFSNTGGLQNNHVMATGSTGLSEAGRETDRTFSKWANLILEAAGGYAGGGSVALASTVLSESVQGVDAGASAGTAVSAPMTALPISGLTASNLRGAIDSGGADVDWYSFTVTDATTLYAEIFSEGRWFGVDDFDSLLQLYGTDGTTVLASNDDVLYSGNTYNGVQNRENDSAILAAALPSAGTYYLSVSSVGAGSGSGDSDGFYNLIFGYDTILSATIPEPNSVSLIAFSAVLIARLRRAGGRLTA